MCIQRIFILIIVPFALSMGPPSSPSSSQPDAPKPPKGDYFDVILDRYEQVEVNKEFSDWDLKVKRFNRTTRALYGTITISKDFGNQIFVEVTTYKKQGGEYRLLPYHVSKAPFCNVLGEDPYVYADLAAKSDLPRNMKIGCPLKVGNYNIDGAFFPLTEAPRTAFQSGDYMAEFIFTQNDELIVKFHVFQCKEEGEYFDVILMTFEQVYANPDFSNWDLAVKRFNRTTRVLAGKVEVKSTEGNDVKVEVLTFKQQGNEYKKMAYKISEAPFCDTARDDEYVYKDLAKNSDFPEKFACPFQEGTYEVNGASFPLEAAPRDAFQSGFYMVEVVFRKDDIVLTQFRVTAEIIHV